MRSHVVYYSRTGATRLLAEALAARTLGEISEIRCACYRRGLVGWLQAGRDTWRGAAPDIAVDITGEDADCLLLGGPVWSGRIAAPVRSYLAGLDALPARVGAFLTSDNPPPHPRAEAEIAALLGRRPEAVLCLTAEDVRAGAHMDEIEDFLRALTHVEEA